MIAFYFSFPNLKHGTTYIIALKPEGLTAGRNHLLSLLLCGWKNIFRWFLTSLFLQLSPINIKSFSPLATTEFT